MERDNKQELDIAILQNNYKSMSDKIDNLQEIVLEGFKELKKELKDNYVSNDKFLPVKILTYGFAGILFTAVILALVSNVIK
jgi:hypothetical protein